MKNEQIFSWRRGLILSATFLIVGLVGFSCKKKNSNIGQNTINQDNILGSKSVDTFSLRTYTLKQDSVITDNSVLALLGQYQDPVFGTFTSGIYTEVNLEGNNPDFGNLSQVIVDSFVLALEYKGVYGEPSDHTVEVFKINDPNRLSLDSIYYSFSTFQTDPTNLVLGGHEIQNFNTSNLTVVDNDTVDPQLRIHLDTNFARNLMNRTVTNPEDFASNEAFLEYFKGIHIKAISIGSGGVHYFSLNDPASKMTIYYTDDQGEKREFDFIINSDCADFNHVTVDNSGTRVEQVIQDTISGNTEFYAQAFSSRAIVEIPGLDSLPKNLVIHKAVLNLPVQYLTGGKYPIGSSVTTALQTNEGLNSLQFLSFATFSNATKSVSLDLRNHIQEVISGKIDNNGIIISPRLFISSAERIIFNGQMTTNKAKPKLTILYTEY